MDRKIKVAVLGCGAMGGTIIGNILDSPYLDSIVGYDISQNSLKKVCDQYGIDTTTDLNRILSDSSIKLVYIASSNDSHVPLSIAAMKAGKAVMTEKPVGLTFAEMDSLVAAQRETGAFIQVGLELRYSTIYKTAKEMIDKGKIGSPVNFHYTYSCSPYGEGNWRVHKANSGSVIHEKLCHYIDVVRWWNGSRVNKYVVTSAQNVIPYFEIEDNVHVSYAFENGAVSQLFFTMTAAPTGNSDMIHMSDDLFDQDKDGHKLNYVITGTKGAIEIDVFQRQLRAYRHAGDPALKGEAAEITQIIKWDKEQDHEYFHNTCAQNRDIIKRVANGEPPSILIEDAAETMRLCVEFSDAQLNRPWQVIKR
ncbi:MAG: Gfo/Idh/MocA family oxidoreductase [Clostridiales bacterium]|jgi:predicted dehydrogenase|nr:Gfo/Idh/MocA family oxidoreductase [Clostridiales bacterium]